MSGHFHAVVWLDHHEAKIFHFSVNDVDRLLVRASDPDQHVHHRANSLGSGRASADDDYYRRVADSVADAGAVLITGPANAKTELLAYIARRDSALLRRISAVQTVDHPTDGALLALARTHFKSDDRMHPQR
jgi:hypothetical protein